MTTSGRSLRAPERARGEPIPSSGITVTEKTKLEIGQTVQVQWGQWRWAGEVLELKQDGSAKIHYTGWSDEWDEVVPRSRLQLPKK